MPKSKFAFYFDITNILIKFSCNFRYIEVFDLTNPRYNECISSVPWQFVKSRFHCKKEHVIERVEQDVDSTVFL